MKKKIIIILPSGAVAKFIPLNEEIVKSFYKTPTKEEVYCKLKKGLNSTLINLIMSAHTKIKCN